jgi:hypothetical protein
MLEEGNDLDERFVAALEYIGRALQNLGTADASTHLGALENLAMELKGGLDSISSSISSGLDNVADFVGK